MLGNWQMNCIQSVQMEMSSLQIQRHFRCQKNQQKGQESDCARVVSATCAFCFCDPYRDKPRTDYAHLDKLIDELVAHVNEKNADCKKGEIAAGGKISTLDRNERLDILQRNEGL